MDISNQIAPTVVEHAQPPQRPPSESSDSAGTDTVATAPATPAVAVDVSGHAQALSTLQTLSATDPQKFKQAALGYADTLKSLAAQTGGPQATHLTRLAQKFAVAGQTGELSGLQPSRLPGGAVQAAYAKDSVPHVPLPFVSPTAVLPRGGYVKGLKSPLVGPGVIVPASGQSQPAKGLVSRLPAAPDGAPSTGIDTVVTPSSNALRFVPAAE